MNVLTFDHVSCRYPGQDTDIVDRLSFEVKPGSFHCILGVSGCGKSTLFRMISGLMSPEKGSIHVNGKPVRGHGSYCGYMPQKDMLFPWRSVGENLALPLEIQQKLSKKHLDLIVANDVTAEGAGFGVDTNIVTLITKDGADPLPKMSKKDVADHIWSKALSLRK